MALSRLALERTLRRVHREQAVLVRKVARLERPITARRLANGAVTTAKLARHAVTASKIRDGAVSERKLSEATVRLAVQPAVVPAVSALAEAASRQTAAAQASAQTAVQPTTAATVAETTLANGAATSDKAADGAIGLPRLNLDSVDTRYARQASGTYVGNGTAEGRFVPVGFTPVQLTLMALGTVETYLSVSDAESLRIGGESNGNGNGPANVTTAVRLAPGGFLAGDGAPDGNAAEVTYRYVAIG